jgi:hypothetical protein
LEDLGIDNVGIFCGNLESLTTTQGYSVYVLRGNLVHFLCFTKKNLATLVIFIKKDWATFWETFLQMHSACFAKRRLQTTIPLLSSQLRCQQNFITSVNLTLIHFINY